MSGILEEPKAHCADSLTKKSVGRLPVAVVTKSRKKIGANATTLNSALLYYGSLLRNFLH